MDICFDELIQEAAKVTVEAQRGSTSLLQRRLRLNYNRASRIMEQLEALGIIGPYKGAAPRDVLIDTVVRLEELFYVFRKV